jgi:hypothetical protein
MKDNLFFIPGAVPSSKNSRMMTRSGFFIASKATQKYMKTTAGYWAMYKARFKKVAAQHEKPLILGFHFVRGSKHKWDFINPAQTIQDEMTKAGWIDDDNVTEILPVPLMIDHEYWSYDKNKPGVYIAVLSSFNEGFINIPKNEITKTK